ncbi:RNA polymerase sigma factor [Hahella ganghwensis]|uniref:RNA polymerase sigma factor n=1 Tax=Hahella ganghwensis TaxID=286420 RepID=UPI000368CD22|nr:sigma-70 family RNA polymerase sigma factor [Hahella ganghwensis]
MQEAIKKAYGPALATLIRLTGEFDLAEDCLQDACLKAVETWNGQVPENPVAWLVTTARNRATDIFRRRQYHQKSVLPFLELVDSDTDLPLQQEQDILRQHLQNDYLCLIFTCCHPALALETQIALTLKTVAGLSLSEVARSLVISEKTMEQRLLRAKHKITQARIAYQIPAPRHLESRLEAVLKVIYLIFNEGYSCSPGEDPIRKSLCQEATSLAETLLKLYPENSEVLGLAALLNFQDSRHSARLSPEGNLVPLPEQDRRLWDQDQITLGQALLDKALRLQYPGPYQVQAAIAALHCTATTNEETDWPQILMLYDSLVRFEDSAIIQLNRAVALAHVYGPDEAITLLNGYAHDKSMQGYSHFYVVIGHLYEMAGNLTEAITNLQKAHDFSKTREEKSYLQNKIDSLLPEIQKKR